MGGGILLAREFCSSIKLVAGGTLTFPGTDDESQVLAQGGTYFPPCYADTTNGVDHLTKLNTLESADSDNDVTYSDFRDPFYASTFPQCYALAAATVVAYMLVIMLVITPRSFIEGGVQVLGRRAGFTGSPSSAPSIGGRPWLQKVAALSVAVSLTIASAETFKEAELQYAWGVENAKTIQREVLGGTLLKVIRLISSTFLWLAQAQTLIRLFPHRREKIIIRWTAGALIFLDMLFDSLNTFLYYTAGNTRPRSFTQAVPTLSYLFQLALGLLYAAWVIYYAVGKRKYAFYHNQMPNMLLVAVLSVTSILIPVVFFILDISKPDFAAWGDYVRWVGAAAASVAVWEWVERIEALEREDKKDGVLGREILDGDDMLEDHSSRGGDAGNGKDTSDATSGGDGNKRARLRNAISSRLRKRWPLAGHLTQSSVSPQHDDRGGTLSRAPSASHRQGATEQQQEVSGQQDEDQQYQPAIWSSQGLSTTTPAGRTDSSSPTTVYDAYPAPYSPRFPAPVVSPPANVRNLSPLMSDTDAYAHPVRPPEAWSPTRTVDNYQGLENQHNGTQHRRANIDNRILDQPSFLPRAEGNMDRALGTTTSPSPKSSLGDNTPPQPDMANNSRNSRSQLRSLASARAKVDQWKARMRDEPSTRHLPTVVIPPPPGPAIESPEVQAELTDTHLTQPLEQRGPLG